MWNADLKNKNVFKCKENNMTVIAIKKATKVESVETIKSSMKFQQEGLQMGDDAAASMITGRGPMLNADGMSTFGGASILTNASGAIADISDKPLVDFSRSLFLVYWRGEMRRSVPMGVRPFPARFAAGATFLRPLNAGWERRASLGSRGPPGSAQGHSWTPRSFPGSHTQPPRTSLSRPRSSQESPST